MRAALLAILCLIGVSGGGYGEELARDSFLLIGRPTPTPTPPPPAKPVCEPTWHYDPVRGVWFRYVR